MYNFVLEIHTQSSTFRNPEFENFHKTFMLPPPTTIIGIAGAALNLSPKASQDYFDIRNIFLGVSGTSEGYAKDLWKYNTFDGKGSIIKKEILFFNKFFIAFASEQEDTIDELEKAFENPGYALTLGNSDSLAKIKIHKNAEKEKAKEIENALLEGDILKEVIENTDNGLVFSIYNSSEPFIYNLPTKFFYESDYGKRKVITRKTFSFIGKKMILNVEKEGLKVANQFIPLFNLK